MSKEMVEVPAEFWFAKSMAVRRLNRPAPGKRSSLAVLTTSARQTAPVFVRAIETGDEPLAEATTV
jgi:hypothetical protein